MAGERYCLYTGTSFYFDGDRFRDPFPICVSSDLDAVIFYMRAIRKYTVVDTRDPDEAAIAEMIEMQNVSNSIQVAGEITKNIFYDGQQMDMFTTTREDLVLVEHAGKVDPQLAHIRKKFSRNVMIPSVVEDIVLAEDEHFYSELEVASHSLKELAIYMGRDQIHQSEKESIFSAITVLDKIIKQKNLTEEILSRHPIFFCSEPEYRQRIKEHTEYREMYEEWKSRCSWEE